MPILQNTARVKLFTVLLLSWSSLSLLWLVETLAILCFTILPWIRSLFKVTMPEKIPRNLFLNLRSFSCHIFFTTSMLSQCLWNEFHSLLFFFDNRNWTQDFIPARQMLCHWAISVAPLPLPCNMHHWHHFLAALWAQFEVYLFHKPVNYMAARTVSCCPPFLLPLVSSGLSMWLCLSMSWFGKGRSSWLSWAAILLCARTRKGAWDLGCSIGDSGKELGLRIVT